ncbi:hypothetical protein M434DRAFT_394721 [Hypoxylon sp. CO27-5]|nr:hypothetical protein M434DRAFT_394721 [Hypoxylon sp. CO27-5]
MLALTPTSAQNQAFLSRWPKLTPHSRQIRLLDIYPATGNDVIECKCHVENLDDSNLEYEALSYVWGNETTKKMIKINGFDEMITDNLHDGLLQLRHQTNTLTIWVDALCINQQDGLEKTHQVDLMSKIYQRCKKCNFWLGNFAKYQPPLAAADVQASFDMVEFICRVTEDVKTKVPQSLETMESRRVAAKTLNVLCTLSWWERIWVVQEAVLPSCSRLIWGSISIGWEWMELISDILVQGKHLNIPFKLSEFWDPTLFRMGMSTIRILRRIPEPALDRLWRVRHRKATNPLDKVYGLMGLLRHVPFSRMSSCDYTLNPSILFKRATLDLIDLEKGLRPLVGRRGERGRTRDLPTWAIDWVPPEDESEKFNRYWCHSWVYPYFQADMGFPMRMFVSEGGSDSILNFTGVFIDTVKIVGRPTDDRYPLECDANRVVQEQIATWRGLLKCAVLEPLHSSVWTRYPLEESFEGLINGKFPAVDVSQIPENGWKKDMCIGQTLLITEMGYLGLGPRTLRSGDEIWILFGGRIPFALRRRETSDGNLIICNDFELVGDAFVYGIMQGNAVSEDQRTIRLH